MRADIAAARARVERFGADRKDAEVRTTREEDLTQRGAGTVAALDDARNRLSSSKAQESAAVAELRAAEARLQAAQVAERVESRPSPFLGALRGRLKDPNEYVRRVAEHAVAALERSPAEAR